MSQPCYLLQPLVGWEELRVGRTAGQSPPEVLQVFNPATAISAASAAAVVVVVYIATAIVAFLFATATSCFLSPPTCVYTHLPSVAGLSGVRAFVFVDQTITQVFVVVADIAASAVDSLGEVELVPV